MKRLISFFTSKFYWGLGLIVASFIIGKIAQFGFIYYVSNPTLRSLHLGIYIFSWLMLFLGVWWVGKEYYESIKKYMSYRFYHDHALHHTSRAILNTTVGTKKLLRGTAEGAKRLHSHLRGKFNDDQKPKAKDTKKL